MADVHDKKTRSYNMSRIRRGNTKPELLVRKFLLAQGFRYSLHKKTLPGKPDIVLPKYKTIIFIHAWLPVGGVASGMDMLTCLAGRQAANILLFPKQERLGG